MNSIRKRAVDYLGEILQRFGVEEDLVAGGGGRDM
jgi:hypothetical protein